MARLINGILGSFSGAIGPVEGYMLKGALIIRSRKQMTHKPPSIKQLSCREKITRINEFLSACIEFVKVGFAWVAKDKRYSAYNAAVAYQIKHAFTGTYPDLEIDYSQVRVSAGPLSTDGIHPNVVKQGNELRFTWTPDLSYEHSTDHVMLLAYSPFLQRSVYNLCGAKRNTGNETLVLPVEFIEAGEIETYLSFKTENGITCTDSLYLGRL
ncbi:hypothetical protein GO495_06670 [Chitinophaga oryziterrae]|uniref:Uncharacterized protein n=1 Tax=Chitinophaga oryziterrae TaxID=1031224 RepID=A0A6N8J6M1_9BACT|nr:DUF6266 family protein [Chitinophaga oryziterrae]MVT40258.1 hypothetical protein [Chitinophaga oryziterrae]